MYALGITQEISGFFGIFNPVSPFLLCINDVDADQPVFHLIRVNVITRKPHFIPAFKTGKKFLDILDLFIPTFLLLLRIGYLFTLEEIRPEFFINFYLVADLHSGLHVCLFDLRYHDAQVIPAGTKG